MSRRGKTEGSQVNENMYFKKIFNQGNAYYNHNEKYHQTIRLLNGCLANLI